MNPKNILIVDDDELVRALFANALSLKGYGFDTAASGKEALEKIKKSSFNLVLLDIDLPDIKGTDLLVSIKQFYPDIIAIMITGSLSADKIVRSLNLGAFGYIQKPVNMDELYVMIKEGIEKQDLIKQIKLARDEWEKTFDAIDDIIIITDKDQIITKINRAGFKMFGSEFKELTGLHCDELMCEEKNDCDYYKTMQEGSDFSPVHYELVNNKLGVHLQVTASPLLDDNVNFSGLVFIARDITEQKKMEARLLHLNKIEAIGSLAGGIVHDFNNILSPIIGFAELLLNDLPPGSVTRDDANEILIAANRGKELVKQILLFSRQGEEKTVCMKIYPVVEETIKMVKAMLPANIKIRTDIENVSEFVMTDPSKIHQIIMNLCTNAFHAMQEKGGVLEVSMSKIENQEDKGLPLKNHIRLMVKDNGYGIDKHTALHIFEPYFTTKAPGQGTGMGLPTIYGIVKAMGGEINFKSEPGKGSIFYVDLPCSKVQVPKKDPVPPVSIKEGSESIIIIDDDIQIVRILKRILEGLGYKVRSYENSLDALKDFKENPDGCDLIITDLVMPEINGIELSQKIMDIRSDIPVIVCTGNQDMINKDYALNLGIRKILPKPVSMRQLSMEIRRIFDTRKQRILIIDDDDQFRKMLRRMLERTGYDIFEAVNGEQGIEIYRNQAVDLVITDMLMPVMNGTDAIYAMTEEFPNIKIIAVSGGGFYDPEIVLNLAQELGAVRTLSKPVNQDILLKTVREILG
ncbi:Two component system response regulator/histidine kinase, PAS domain-containing [Desulfonema limicola]|uniref:histidine kinase n=1 Tax=Desulfonema limicola TaxID=45656 RepID=A0A975GGW8_9BACT|nr:response regulator [Desulfonema limicola]QTA80801.1 Two component system response regulator/histidine kinase, PAS domain-containing [Desulfonema limicola]